MIQIKENWKTRSNCLEELKIRNSLLYELNKEEH
jgi:hypothetical protein